MSGQRNRRRNFQAPRVSPDMIERMYRSDASGLLDAELVQEIERLDPRRFWRMGELMEDSAPRG